MIKDILFTWVIIVILILGILVGHYFHVWTFPGRDPCRILADQCNEVYQYEPLTPRGTECKALSWGLVLYHDKFTSDHCVYFLRKLHLWGW